MNRAMLGMVTLMVATLGIQEVAMAEEPEEKAEVQIVIGRASYEYKEKMAMPIPEVPIGKDFDIEVEWKGDTGEDQVLVLSDFVAVTADLEAVSVPSERCDQPIWQRIEGEGLTIEGEGYVEPEDGKVKFRNPAPGAKSRGTFKLHGPKSLEDDDQLVLIFFNVELETAKGETVLFDPPWAKKRRG